MRDTTNDDYDEYEETVRKPQREFYRRQEQEEIWRMEREAARRKRDLMGTFGLAPDGQPQDETFVDWDAYDRRRKANGQAGPIQSAGHVVESHHVRPGADQNGRTSFRLIPFNAIKLSTAVDYAIKGIFPRDGLGVVWGAPKCGKSFWTFDAFMHVALGWLYRGRKVQQGPVVYCALEGGRGFSRRVEAWRRRHLAEHQGDVPPFYLIDVPLDLVRDHAGLIAAVRAALGDQKPVTIVVDTLNRALVGDENKSDDMAKLIRSADLLRSAFGCLVVLVHHCGIAGGRPRGHTSLAGADDVQIAVEKDDAGTITATVEHMKDGEAGAVVVSRLERVELGADDEGDIMSSCVIEPATAVAPKPKLTGPIKLALEVLHELVGGTSGTQPNSTHVPANAVVVSMSLWREYFFQKRAGTNRDTNKKAFSRAVDRLQELHIIGVWGDSVWLGDKPGQTGTNRILSP